MSTRPERGHDPVRDLFALGDPAEDVDEDRLHVRVVVDDLERARHDLGVRPAADVEEVRRLAADLADDVDGAHRQAGAVGDDPDVPVEPDVLETLVVGRALTRVAHLRGVVLLVLRMAEHRVVVERHLGVEGMDAPLGREDQRVDLDEVSVGVDVAAPELHEDVDRTVGGRGIETRRGDPLLALRGRQSVDGVDVHPCDRVRVLVGDLLDLHAAFGGEHPEMQLRRPIEREGRVVLAGDVARLLDPEQRDDVALDVHPEDLRRVLATLVGVGGELDARPPSPARPPAPAP